MLNEVEVVNNKKVACVGNFTSDQAKAYKNIIEFINAPYDCNDYKRALVGAAGTGKTYLVKSLIQNCKLNYSQIGLAAPTHKATRVLSESIKIKAVNTLASDLGLRVNFNIENFDIKNIPFDPKGRVKIGDYQLYIVDEASMINKGLLNYLEKICRENECKILYIGDDYQLAPVKEFVSLAFKNIKLFKLTQVVRQGNDNPVSHLLNLLRYDIEHKTFTFLEYIVKHPYQYNEGGTKGYQVCDSKKFKEIVCSYFSDEQLKNNIDYVKVISYTNDNVSGWNKYIRNSIIDNAETSIITKNDLIISYDTIVNEFNDNIITNSEEYVLKDVVNYVDPKYNLKGYMVRFIAIHGGGVSTPLFILDHTDKFSLNMYVKISNELIDAAKSAPSVCRAARWRDYFEFKQKVLLLTNIKKIDNTMLFSRNLDYGFALTAHKSQGSTFNVALVDVNDIVYDSKGKPWGNIEETNRRLYVACSRCKDKLYLKYG